MSGRSKPPSVHAAFSSAPYPSLSPNLGSNGNSSQNLASFELTFSFDELHHYIENRKLNLSKHSLYWIDTAGKLLWEYTRGIIKQRTMEDLKNYVLTHYQSKFTWNKILCFVDSFLKYLGKLYLNAQYQSFSLFLERPHPVKERKLVNTRQITIQDLNAIFSKITEYYQKGDLPYSNYINYLALVGFGGYTAQRMHSTIMKITVGMVRVALKDKQYPVLIIPPMMDKIRYEHHVPIHSNLIPLLKEAIKHRNNGELMFKYIAFNSWIVRNPIALTQIKGVFKPSDLRKFGEQYGDQIGWETVNRAHIMSHDISSISFTHYKSFTSEMVYNVYMKAWGEIKLIPDFQVQSTQSPQNIGEK
ncbi:MAG: hypothetical protein ABR999_02375 [Methanoregula sp.]|uniref:hypothetical protein n=1 Tax=Methanoregula sp. TaxID=2052170 RepID=UPI003D0F076C